MIGGNVVETLMLADGARSEQDLCAVDVNWELLKSVEWQCVEVEWA